MANNWNATATVAVIFALIVGLGIGFYSQPAPEVITETEYVETIVEVPVEVEVPATGLDALDDLVDSAKDYFNNHLYKIDEFDGTDYDLDEIDIEDYDNVNLEIDDWDDNEYTVSFNVDVEYDDDVEATWLIEVSYDEDGEIDLDCTVV